MFVPPVCLMNIYPIILLLKTQYVCLFRCWNGRPPICWCFLSNWGIIIILRNWAVQDLRCHGVLSMTCPPSWWKHYLWKWLAISLSRQYFTGKKSYFIHWISVTLSINRLWDWFFFACRIPEHLAWAMLTTSESTAVILPNKHSLCQIKDSAHHKKKKRKKNPERGSDHSKQGVIWSSFKGICLSKHWSNVPYVWLPNVWILILLPLFFIFFFFLGNLFQNKNEKETGYILQIMYITGTDTIL